MTMLKVAAITIGGQLLSGKIASNRGQKGAIGSGTVPSVEAGPTSEIAPVEGTEVLDFGDFSSESFAEPEIDQQEQQQQLIQQLIDAGYDPEALGIAGLAFGGPLYRSPGGILSVEALRNSDLPLAEIYKILHEQGLIDPNVVTDGIPEKVAKEAGYVEDDPFGQGGVDPNNLVDVDTSSIEDPNFRAQMGEWWEGQAPEVQGAVVTAGIGLIKDLFKKPAKGSQVMTQTLPGNSARRRAAQMNIKPIQGSQVKFAESGGVLDRKMFAQNFMPDGGDITGPGGPKDDLIPVMASNGEYMLSKAAVDQAGQGNHAKGVAALEAFNALGNMRYG